MITFTTQEYLKSSAYFFPVNSYFKLSNISFNYFFYSRSRLGNLFGIDKASSQGGNESLTYTAPKQPKPKGMDYKDIGFMEYANIATACWTLNNNQSIL